jgi:circadian clock protein KaiB
MRRHLLKLYVAGNNRRTEQAIACVRELIGNLKDRYDLQVIDILTEPRLAIFSGVFAVPTLVKDNPPPSRRLLGDLSNTQEVSEKLGLTEALSP